MNVKITSFSNPFSFFCVPHESCGEGEHLEGDILGESGYITNNQSKIISDVDHGQYVAVRWKGTWARGIISMETQFRIWLVDYGFYLRPDMKTVFTSLSSEYKKMPTKVFEASIHGVAPVDKILTDDGRLVDQISSSWNHGCVDRAKSLITAATSSLFVPVVLLLLKNNSIVIGDLYLELPDRGLVNIIDELLVSPTFLIQSENDYLSGVQNFYKTHQKHYSCNLKPETAGFELKEVTIENMRLHYNSICENSQELANLFLEPELESKIVTEEAIDGSMVAKILNKNNECNLTAEEMEKYSKMYVKIGEKEYNVLHVILNKIRDLKICERYKDLETEDINIVWNDLYVW